MSGQISLGYPPECLQNMIKQRSSVYDEEGRQKDVELLSGLRQAEEKLKALSKVIKSNDIDRAAEIPGGLDSLKARCALRVAQVKAYQALADQGVIISCQVTDRLRALVHATRQEKDKIQADALALKKLAERVHHQTTEESDWRAQNLGGNLKELQLLVERRRAEEEDGYDMIRRPPAEQQPKSWGSKLSAYARSFF